MKKGFTLIEMLAVIVVIALVSVIVIPIILSSLNGIEEKYYAQNESSLLSASENYMQEQLLLNPTLDFENMRVTYEELISSKKITKITLYQDNEECTGYVDYLGKDFNVCLICGDYMSSYCEAIDPIEENYIIYEEASNYIDIYPTFDSGVKFDQTIGAQKNSTYFSVLTYNRSGYDTRGLLVFDINSIDLTEVEKVEVHAYYYNSDIPSRQQTHPVRYVTEEWSEDDLLTDSMMSDTYSCRMTSLSTANYGYGWRTCDVTDIVNYWQTNPNYGLVIDHNRGLSNAGGYWSRMNYYSSEANQDFIPKLRVYLNESYMKKYLIINPAFDSSVRVGQTIGAQKESTYFSALSYNSPGYDERGLLKFDLPSSDKYEYKSAEIFAYYYTSDIPSRQQTHPVRYVTEEWSEDDLLIDSMMSDTYSCRMTSLSTSNYGYGWRRCNITDIVAYWQANPNYGLVIDHNRGLSDAGGYWSRMQYYTNESGNGLEPYVKVYIEEK